MIVVWVLHKSLILSLTGFFETCLRISGHKVATTLNPRVSQRYCLSILWLQIVTDAGQMDSVAARHGWSGAKPLIAGPTYLIGSSTLEAQDRIRGQRDPSPEINLSLLAEGLSQLHSERASAPEVVDENFC